MKIAYIANSTIPSKTANSIHVMKMCQAFKQKGADIVLIVPDVGDTAERNGVFDFYAVNERFEILRVPLIRVKGADIIFAYRALKLARDRNVDLIYTRNSKAGFLASIFNLPFIIELHRIPLSIMDNVSLRFSRNSSNLKKIAITTNALGEWYINRALPKEKIVVSPDAVDIGSFPKVEYFSWDRKRRLKIGYCGHLYKGRGIDIIIKIARKLCNCDFIIVGGNNGEIEHWRDIAQKEGVDNIYFKGFILNKDIPEILLNMDILLMPYQKVVTLSGNKGDTSKFMSPLKMFEYMATGKPIIASELPVLKEVLRDRENSILVKPNSPKEWTEAIEFLIDNPDFAVKIGINARREVEEKYTWKKRVDKILDGAYK